MFQETTRKTYFLPNNREIPLSACSICHSSCQLSLERRLCETINALFTPKSYLVSFGKIDNHHSWSARIIMGIWSSADGTRGNVTVTVADEVR
jgi:hypothetical protein